MRAVQRFEGDLCRFFSDGESSSYLASAMPGPVTFLKFVLGVPMWPITLSLWGIFRSAPSDEHFWVWPPAWLGLSGFSASRVLDWFLFPHYICNWVAVPLLLMGLAMQMGYVFAFLLMLPFVFVLEACLVGTLWRWYFGTTDGDYSRMKWTRELAARVKRGVFEDAMVVIGLEALGSALSSLVTADGTFRVVALFFLVQAALLGAAIFLRDCAEQEWALAAVHLGWSMVVLCAKSCTLRNPFVTSLQIGCESDEDALETGEIDLSTASDSGESVSKSATVACAQ